MDNLTTEVLSKETALASAVDWNDVISRQSDLKYYLEITIPAALQRNDVIGHSLLVCPYQRFLNVIIEQIENTVSPRSVIREGSIDYRLGEKGFISRLLCLNEHDIYVQSARNLKMTKIPLYKVQTLLNDYYGNIIIGRGCSAEEIQIDIPHFTSLTIANDVSEVDNNLINLYENLIHIDIANDEICMMEVQEELIRRNMKAEYVVAEKIATSVNGNWNLIAGLVKRIEDYLLVTNKANEIITEEIVDSILFLLV